MRVGGSRRDGRNMGKEETERKIRLELNTEAKERGGGKKKGNI